MPTQGAFTEALYWHLLVLSLSLKVHAPFKSWKETMGAKHCLFLLFFLLTNYEQGMHSYYLAQIFFKKPIEWEESIHLAWTHPSHAVLYPSKHCYLFLAYFQELFFARTSMSVVCRLWVQIEYITKCSPLGIFYFIFFFAFFKIMAMVFVSVQTEELFFCCCSFKFHV